MESGRYRDLRIISDSSSQEGWHWGGGLWLTPEGCKEGRSGASGSDTLALEC